MTQGAIEPACEELMLRAPLARLGDGGNLEGMASVPARDLTAGFISASIGNIIAEGRGRAVESIASVLSPAASASVPRLRACATTWWGVSPGSLPIRARRAF